MELPQKEPNDAGRYLVENGFTRQFWGRDACAERVCDRLDAASLLVLELSNLNLRAPVQFGAAAVSFLSLSLCRLMQDKAVPVRGVALEAVGLLASLLTQPDDLKEVSTIVPSLVKKVVACVCCRGLEASVLTTLSRMELSKLVSSVQVYEVLVGYLVDRIAFDEDDLRLLRYTVSRRPPKSSATAALVKRAVNAAQNELRGSMLTSCITSMAILFNDRSVTRGIEGILDLPLQSLTAAAAVLVKQASRSPASLGVLAGIKLGEIVAT